MRGSRPSHSHLGARSYASGRLPLGRTSLVMDGLLRWEIEELLDEIRGPGEHRIVTRGQLHEPPLGTLEFTEQGLAARDHLSNLIQREAAQYPQLGQLFSSRVLKAQGLGVGAKRLRSGPGVQQPKMIFIYPLEAGHVGQLFLRWYRELPTLAQLLHLLLGSLSKFGRELLNQATAVGKRRGVQVHQLGDALGDAIGRARDHEPTVAVPKEHHVVEVLELYELHHIGYVSIQVDLGRGKVNPLAEAGEGGGIGVVAFVPQLPGDLLPAPSSQPTATDQHVSCHLQNLLVIPKRFRTLQFLEARRSRYVVSVFYQARVHL